MGKVSLLVDTDIFIDYFNTGRFHALFDSHRFTVYYSVITKKELLEFDMLAKYVERIVTLRRD